MTKEYNRNTKRWENVTEQVGDLKKPKLCKGGVPHVKEICLPKFIEDNYFRGELTPKIVEEYYASEKRLYDVKQIESKVKANLGFIFHEWNGSGEYIHYRCTKCGKRDY